jgi:streptogramin lyase
MGQTMAPRRRPTLLPFALFAILGALLVAAPAGAAKPKLVHTFGEGVHPGALAVDGEGAAWFVGSKNYPARSSGPSYFIGRLGPEGKVSRFPIAAGHGAGAPVAMPGGDVWFSEVPKSGPEAAGVAEVVGFTAAGQAQSYALGSEVVAIEAMTQMGGELWFSGKAMIAGSEQSTLGSVAVSTGGAVRLFPLPSGCRAPAITATATAVWFGETCERGTIPQAELAGSAVGTIDAAGNITRQPIAIVDVPQSAAAGPEGTVWFGTTVGNYNLAESRAVRITAAGELAEFKVPEAGFFDGVAVGPEGRLWFDLFGYVDRRHPLGSIGPAGHIGRRGCLERQSCGLSPSGFTTGPEGDLWFVGLSADRANGGGGGAGLMQEEAFEREPGTIWRLRP